jgi:hypothetical protein
VAKDPAAPQARVTEIRSAALAVRRSPIEQSIEMNECARR